MTVQKGRRRREREREIGDIEEEDLDVGDIDGRNPSTNLIIEKLPSEHDPRVSAVEFHQKTNHQDINIRGVSTQIKVFFLLFSFFFLFVSFFVTVFLFFFIPLRTY
jgi:ATP-dependent 26S proteasome regulatory subunit